MLKKRTERKSKTLLESLDALIQEHHLLKHPFYEAWAEGKLSKESLQLYAE
jgi:pyrroloquinoline-quinone synthase